MILNPAALALLKTLFKYNAIGISQTSCCRANFRDEFYNHLDFCLESETDVSNISKNLDKSEAIVLLCTVLLQMTSDQGISSVSYKRYIFVNIVLKMLSFKAIVPVT